MVRKLDNSTEAALERDAATFAASARLRDRAAGVVSGDLAADVRRLQAELACSPALLAEAKVVRATSPAPEAERIIRCSSENIERAICRALARAVVHGEYWRVDLEAENPR